MDSVSRTNTTNPCSIYGINSQDYPPIEKGQTYISNKPERIAYISQGRKIESQPETSFLGKINQAALQFGNTLNRGADSVLGKMADVGQGWKQFKGISENLSTVLGFIEPSFANSTVRGLASKFVTALDSATNVVSIMEAVADDRSSNNNSYSNSMAAIARGATQTAVGIGVGLALPVSILGAGTIAPVVIIGSAMAGAAWATGKCLDWISL
jgi:hypothetical protein